MTTWKLTYTYTNPQRQYMKMNPYNFTYLIQAIIWQMLQYVLDLSYKIQECLLIYNNVQTIT